MSMRSCKNTRRNGFISLRFLGYPRPTRENGRPGPPRTAFAILTDGASLLQTINTDRTIQTNSTHFLRLPSSYHSSTLVSVTSFPSQESRMTTWDLIIALFYHVDEQLHDLPTHPEAHLWPSEVITLGLVELSRRVTPLDWSPKPCLPVS